MTVALPSTSTTKLSIKRCIACTRQLIQKLQESYRPHEDRGWLRTKAEQLHQDVTEICRQLQAPGIRTLADKEKLLSSYQRFALDSVKTIMFVEQELPLMLPAQEQAVNFSMTM